MAAPSPLLFTFGGTMCFMCHVTGTSGFISGYFVYIADSSDWSIYGRQCSAIFVNTSNVSIFFIVLFTLGAISRPKHACANVYHLLFNLSDAHNVSKHSEMQDIRDLPHVSADEGIC